MVSTIKYQFDEDTGFLQIISNYYQCMKRYFDQLDIEMFNRIICWPVYLSFWCLIHAIVFLFFFYVDYLKLQLIFYLIFFLFLDGVCFQTDKFRERNYNAILSSKLFLFTGLLDTATLVNAFRKGRGEFSQLHAYISQK